MIYPRAVLRALTLATLLVAACAGRADPPASRGVDAWRHALASDDADAAYRLLTPATRKQLPADAWRARWKESRAERLAMAASLEAPPGPAIDERATVTLRDGAGFELRREAGAWRLGAPLAAGLVARTPGAALARLHAALGGESAEAILRLIAAKRREPLRELLGAFRRGLVDHAADVVEVSPERALLEWTDGPARYRVDLVREGADWRVDDVRLP